MFKLFFSAVLAGSSLSGAAMAQDVPAGITVSYRDLDLRDSSAVKTLDRRLSRAIEAACHDDQSARDLSLVREIWRCKEGKRAEIATLRTAAIAKASRPVSDLAAAR